MAGLGAAAELQAADPLRAEIAAKDFAVSEMQAGLTEDVMSMVIRPFDAPSEWRQFPAAPLIATGFGSSVSWSPNYGGVALFHSNLALSWDKRDSTSVVDRLGRTLWTLQGQRVFGSLAPGLDRIAQLGPEGDERTVLRVMERSGSVNDLAVLPGLHKENGSAVAWSADEKHLAFSWDEKIYIHDIQGGKTEEQFPGTDPSWSPNGRNFSYRDHDGNLLILDGDRRVLRVAGWDLKWSPDSEYFI
jgi:hypothetical protein